LPVMAQNSGYDRFPPAANGWETIYPVLGYGPPLQFITFPPYDRHGQAGFHHLSAHPASLVNPRQGLGPRSNTPGGFPQLISIASLEDSRSGDLRCLA
jgi:hypothetical protein